jgi:hypothetical protein
MDLQLTNKKALVTPAANRRRRPDAPAAKR